MRKLKEVDPVGYETFLDILKKESIARIKRKHLAKVIPLPALKEEHVVLEDAVKGLTDTSVIRFIPMDGIRKVVALTYAAGYKEEEIAAMLKIPLESLRDMKISDDEIKEIRKSVPNAIVKLADQVVLKDLLGQDVTDRTSRADLIASRRRKLTLDASEQQRKEDLALQKQRADHLSQRFGVDVKTIEGTAVGTEGEQV
jgi:hypothetical protein